MTVDVKVLGVGTIVEASGANFMITGYRLVDGGGMVGLAYVVVPYPLGFVGADSVSLITASKEYRVIAAGLKDEESQSFVEMLSKAQDEGKETPFEVYSQAMYEHYSDTQEEVADNE